MINSKISVIMPVYNTQETYLREAIESILSQTYDNFEFIIVDDGSTNNAQAVIKSFSDPRIRYVHQENRGIAHALNHGLDIAQGEYIARMDSDDIALPERFAKQIAYLEQNPEISILGTAMEYFPSGFILRHPQNIGIFAILYESQISHPTAMWRRSDLEKYNLRYNPQFACEDYELWSRAIRYLRLANIPDVLLKYRIHQQQLCSTKTELIRSDIHRVKSNILSWLSYDRLEQNKILDLCSRLYMKPPSFWQRIFAIRNECDYKVLRFMGFKIRLSKKR